MSAPIRRTAAHRNPTARSLLATVVVAMAAVALPANALAAINSPPANGHSILSFPARDFVSADGYNNSDRVTVEVLRNGVPIGTASNVTPRDDPSTPLFDGLVEVNHPGGACWQGVTPDILPGDVVRLTTAPGVGDETPTANVRVTQLATNVGGDIVVRGTAQDATGAPLPIGVVEQRLIAGGQTFDANGSRSLRSPGQGIIRYDAPGSINWTTTYTGLSSADQARAVGAESRILWLGRDNTALTPLGSPPEVTVFEAGGDNPAIPGPAAPCTAPLARTGITSLDRTLVNVANAGTPLRVSGAAAAGITRVTVSVPGGSPRQVTPSGGVWTVDVPASDLAAAPQGTFNVTAAFTGTGAPPSETRSVSKDTVAPAAPTAAPAAGTYETAQLVSLGAEPGSVIHWTSDGSPASAANATYGGPIPIASSTTIGAVAVDGAGNAGPGASFAYLIVPKPVPQVVPAPVTSGSGGSKGSTSNGGTSAGSLGSGANSDVSGAGSAGQPGAAQANVLRVRRLRVAAGLNLAVARQGILVKFGAPAGSQIVRLRLFRVNTGASARKVKVVVTKFVLIKRSGPHRIQLLVKGLQPGNYRLGVRIGGNTGKLGPAVMTDFRVRP